ncbi:MAG: DNA damage-inducible protein D [Alphaproteobacteria bacterium]|nr:DNA damage-inducible protein D [Alphaproteobacteria bacterium]
MNSNLTTDVFDKIRYYDDNNVEYWSARELYSILEYKDWRNFENVVSKAKEACKNSDHAIVDHFVDVTKMVKLGSGSEREIEDVLLSRYACYLIIQNADPSKPIIAQAQTYFAIQTRKQEIQEEADILEDLNENQRRLYLRRELSEHNKQLVETAKNAGVETQLDYAIFQNYGYKGLYNGMSAQDIHHHKGLKKNEKILDHMGSTELAANLFRATQTEEKIKRENIHGKFNANKAHYEVGRKVRQTIQELGGTMPEDLPAAPSIKSIEREEKKKLEKKG